MNIDVEIKKLLERVRRMKNDTLFEEPCPIYEADVDDWEDFWYSSESEGKDMPKDTTPKTFSYDGWIPKKVFGIQTKQFYEKDGRPFIWGPFMRASEVSRQG